MKIIYFGTPWIAAEVLKYLLDHAVQVAAVITKPDRPQGRSGMPVPTPVKIVAESHVPQIPVYQPEIVSAPEFADVLKAYEADLFVVVAYGEIIKQHLLDMPKLGCINMHASLLPKYRGAAPIQRSIINGEKESGVTIMHMVKKMDAGDMIKTARVPIGPDMTAGELEQALCRAGSKALLEVIHAFEAGEVAREPQDHNQATLAPKIELEDTELKWDCPAQDLHNLARGATPHPGAWCYVNVRGQKKRLKILKTQVVPEKSGRPGEIVSLGKDGLILACGQQALRLLEIQLEGKKPMSPQELLRGVSLEFL